MVVASTSGFLGILLAAAVFGAGLWAAAIALGKISRSDCNWVTSVLVSGIPVGATLSDGTPGHSFTSATGTTSHDITGWSYGALTLTPANDANAALSVVVRLAPAERPADRALHIRRVARIVDRQRACH